MKVSHHENFYYVPLEVHSIIDFYETLHEGVLTAYLSVGEEFVKFVYVF